MMEKALMVVTSSRHDRDKQDSSRRHVDTKIHLGCCAVGPIVSMVVVEYRWVVKKREKTIGRETSAID
jgi:hypothetical protein